MSTRLSSLHPVSLLHPQDNVKTTGHAGSVTTYRANEFSGKGVELAINRVQFPAGGFHVT